MLGISHGDRAGRACMHAGRIGSVARVTGVCACLIVGERTRAMHAESGRVERVGARHVSGLGMRIVERVVSEQAGVGCGVCVLYSSLLCTGSGASWAVSHVAEWLSLCSGKEIHKGAVRAAGGVRAPAKNTCVLAYFFFL